MMQAEIYEPNIIELAGNIERIGNLPKPDASAGAKSRLCGSHVHVEICVKGEHITNFAHKVEACALGQACAAIIAKNIIGSSAGEVFTLSERLAKILTGEASAPKGKWAELKIFENMEQYKHRHHSIMLGFEALEKCLSQLGLGKKP